jgi:cytochrome P450
MADELEARRNAPRDDLLTALVTAEAEGTIDGQEAEDLAVMVLIGGIDTTMAALSTAFLRIQREPGVRARLLDEPALLTSAIEEFLRIDPPVQGFARGIQRDCVVGGQALAEGETLFMLWGSANRDEAMFPEADEFHIDRHPNRHLTFGIGGHRCLGATLARVEMKVVLEEVLARLPDYLIDESGVRYPDTIGIVYGMVNEPATFTPGRRLA